MSIPDNDQPAPKIELSITPEPVEASTDTPVDKAAETDDETAGTETSAEAEAGGRQKPERKSPEPVNEAAQMREAYDQFLSDDTSNTDLSLKTVLGGDILATKWFLKQLPFILFLSILSIGYVSNRYGCQQETIDKKRLTNKLEDRRKRAIVAECNLTEFCRRTNIQSLLRDTTLRMSNDSYYYIKVGDTDSHQKE